MGLSIARVICNPASGGGDYDPGEIRAALEGLEIEWMSTESTGDAEKFAREWQDGLLIVAGGDGTVNEVINGLGLSGFPENVTLALLPTGTGNDLASTLAIPDEPEEAERIIGENRVRTLDVARVSSEGVGERFFINVASGGFGAEVSGTAEDKDLKKRWGSLAYFRASLEVAKRFEVRETSLLLDGEEHMINAINVVVANCRYAGGGWLAAPKANPEDGLLDIIVIEEAGLGEILSLAPAALSRGDYLEKDSVFHTRASKVTVRTAPPGLEFNADGELIGNEPAEFSVIPRALKVVVGPDYVPAPR